MKKLAIIGSGDLGNQIAHFAISDKIYSEVYFIDDYCNLEEVNGIKVIGKVKDAQSLFDKDVFDELIIGIGYRHLQKKKEIFENLNGKIPFGKIIHSTCIIDSTAVIKKGSVLYPGSIIDAKVIIGENCLINIGCTIAHDTNIESHCFLSPRVAIAGFVNIEELCILGINATIIDNIALTKNIQIGGGALVVKNLKKKGLYVGAPVRFLK